MDKKVPEYCDPDICTKCGGSCCKNMGCHFAPSDFPELSFDFLKNEIEKGYISIDWWEGDHYPEHYLRMRHKNADIVDPSWGGECVMLTDKGCSFPFDKRPLGARALEPREKGQCVVHYSKEECKNEWGQYSDILWELRKYFSEKEELK